MAFPTKCEWQGCEERRERGFVYCHPHLRAEQARWLAEQESEER